MQLGWIDFSKKDRDKVLDVINLLHEEGAVDELGIGTIRDAFANYFFPGTSTVQTRAKYFCIVPYILKEAADGSYGDNIDSIMKKIDVEERKCGEILLLNCPNADGIIGKRVLPEQWVARTPSNIYWNGIRTLGIFKNKSLSISEFIKLSCSHRNQIETINLGNINDSQEDSDRDDTDAGDIGHHNLLKLPNSYNPNWREQLNIELTQDEAMFLRNRIISQIPNSLFAYLLKNNIDVEKYDSFSGLFEDIKNDVPHEMKELMDLAVHFNQLVYVARVRYNIILSNGNNEQANIKWDEIISSLSKRMLADLPIIFNKLQINNIRVKNFLVNLRNALINEEFDEVDRLIRKQEIDIKGVNRAKLNRSHEYADDTWVGGTWLDYRFGDAKKIIRDIYASEG